MPKLVKTKEKDVVPTFEIKGEKIPEFSYNSSLKWKVQMVQDALMVELVAKINETSPEKSLEKAKLVAEYMNKDTNSLERVWTRRFFLAHFFDDKAKVTDGPTQYCTNTSLQPIFPEAISIEEEGFLPMI